MGQEKKRFSCSCSFGVWNNCFLPTSELHSSSQLSVYLSTDRQLEPSWCWWLIRDYSFSSFSFLKEYVNDIGNKLLLILSSFHSYFLSYYTMILFWRAEMSCGLHIILLAKDALSPLMHSALYRTHTRAPQNVHLFLILLVAKNKIFWFYYYVNIFVHSIHFNYQRGNLL